MRSSGSLARLETPLRLVEPSTDFDFEPEDGSIGPPRTSRRRWAKVAAASAIVLILGAGVGFAAGRATAPAVPPAPCLQALSTAEHAFVDASATFSTAVGGLLAVIDGELPEAYDVHSGVVYGEQQLARLQAEFDRAAASCRLAA